MEDKRKQNLIKLYEENYKEWFYWYDVEDYVESNKNIYKNDSHIIEAEEYFI